MYNDLKSDDDDLFSWIVRGARASNASGQRAAPPFQQRFFARYDSSLPC